MSYTCSDTFGTVTPRVWGAADLEDPGGVPVLRSLGCFIHLGSTPRRGEFDFSKTNPGQKKSQPHNWARPFVLCKFATQQMAVPNCGVDFFVLALVQGG